MGAQSATMEVQAALATGSKDPTETLCTGTKPARWGAEPQTRDTSVDCHLARGFSGSTRVSIAPLKRSDSKFVDGFWQRHPSQNGHSSSLWLSGTSIQQ